MTDVAKTFDFLTIFSLMVALIVGDLFTVLMFVIFLLWSQGIFKQTGVKTNKQQ